MSKHWITGCTVVMVLFEAVPTSALAQEKYTIKLKEVGPGETLRAESRETTLSKNQTQMEKDKAPGKATEEKTTKELVFTETVLLRPEAGKMPTKIKRVYEKAEVTTFMGSTTEKPKPQPYHGKAVWIDKKDAAYEFRFEGGEAFKDATLDSEFNGGQQESHKRLFLPAMPVAVGDTWRIDTAPLLQGFKKDEKVTVQKGEGTGKLVKVYTKDGRKFGVIEVAIAMEFTLEIKEVDPKTKGSLKATQKQIMKVAFDGCVDGTLAEGRVHSTLEYNSTSVYRVPDTAAVSFITSGSTTGDDNWKELPKK
jgi:hypothetical protein